jgi:excisionase family DNA binding protein
LWHTGREQKEDEMAGVAETTLLPEPESQAQIISLLEAMAAKGKHVPDARSRLIGPDGRSVEIPPQIHDVLIAVADALGHGQAVSIVPQNTVLTTQQAANFLGVSRPTLVSLLEAGKLPYERPGRHRRVRLADLLDYQRRTRSAQREALAEMTAESVELGLYDLAPDHEAP